jgi:hypothetical protein
VAQSVQCLTTYWGTGVRSPTEAKDLPSNLCVQTSSEAHPASCTMGTGGPFLGAKRGRGVTLTTHPIYCQGQKLVGATPSPPGRLHGVAGHFTFTFISNVVGMKATNS